MSRNNHSSSNQEDELDNKPKSYVNNIQPSKSNDVNRDVQNQINLNSDNFISEKRQEFKENKPISNAISQTPNGKLQNKNVDEIPSNYYSNLKRKEDMRQDSNDISEFIRNKKKY